jgi:uncharacterized protein YjbI with pentapeptide repeats
MKATTYQANFEDANLSDVLMDRAVMNEANLKNAVLQRAIFTRSDLTGAIVEGADFSNALLDKTQQLVSRRRYRGAEHACEPGHRACMSWGCRARISRANWHCRPGTKTTMLQL